jgi:hypothetical protein
MNHLDPRILPMMSKSDEVRKKFIKRPRWIPHGTATTALNRLTDILEAPIKDRPDCMLLVGPSNNGKTALLKHFEKTNRPDPNPNGDTGQVPVLLVQSPPGPDEARLFVSILEAIGASVRTNVNVRLAESKALNLMAGLKVKVLVIDEAHSAFSRLPSNHKYYLNVIKRISNVLRLPVVMAGTKDLLQVSHLDAQFSNRLEPSYLPRWHLTEDYLRLLDTFEQLIPLHNSSNLRSDGISALLHGFSEGLIGELSKLLERAALNAIETQQEVITAEQLQKLVTTKQFIPPSQRHVQDNLDID